MNFQAHLYSPLSLSYCRSQALMSAFRMGLGYFLDRKGGPIYTYQETLLPKFVDRPNWQLFKNHMNMICFSVPDIKDNYEFLFLSCLSEIPGEAALFPICNNVCRFIVKDVDSLYKMLTC